MHYTLHVLDIFKSLFCHISKHFQMHSTELGRAVLRYPKLWLLTAEFVCVIFASCPSCANNLVMSTPGKQKLFPHYLQSFLLTQLAASGGLSCVLGVCWIKTLQAVICETCLSVEAAAVPSTTRCFFCICCVRENPYQFRKSNNTQVYFGGQRATAVCLLEGMVISGRGSIAWSFELSQFSWQLPMSFQN